MGFELFNPLSQNLLNNPLKMTTPHMERISSQNVFPTYQIKPAKIFIGTDLD